MASSRPPCIPRQPGGGVGCAEELAAPTGPLFGALRGCENLPEPHLGKQKVTPHVDSRTAASAHSAFEVQYHGSLPKWISANFGLHKMESGSEVICSELEPLKRHNQDLQERFAKDETKESLRQIADSSKWERSFERVAMNARILPRSEQIGPKSEVFWSSKKIVEVGSRGGCRNGLAWQLTFRPQRQPAALSSWESSA